VDTLIRFMCRTKLTLLAVLAALSLPAAARADAPPAYSAACGPGAAAPTCQFWYGKVTFIGDGDTVSVDLDGDHTKTPVHVRITGINAMEESVHTDRSDERSGDCHAGEATARLEYLVKAAKGRVRLAAQDPTNTSRGRLRRAVAVKIHGRYRDVGRTMLVEGHALPLPTGDEWAFNVSYGILAERAARNRVNLWNPSFCSGGPDEAAQIRVIASWDAPGSDRRNPNGEWVKIKNLDPVNPLSLAGWWLRDSGLRRYTFHEGAFVPPSGALTVNVGPGEDSGYELFWGLAHGAFDNAPHNGKGEGDGAYLFDPDGDLRSYMMWPCRRDCSDPLQGAVKITAAYRRSQEFVTVQNVSGAAVDLDGYRIDSPPYGYTIDGDAVLQPGEQLQVNVEGDPAEDTRLVRNWGLDHAILGNAGDRVRLQTLTDIVIDCQAWGSASC
jgi:endonuclease YncB( thermonuclease family)